MSKISIEKCNDFCPQTLFAYGTYREDGRANFGLFCWMTYYWDTDLGVVACIGGSKKTRDLIHKNNVFSANLVTQEMLPLADYFGNKEGYDPQKMNIKVDVEKGAVLDVPVLVMSPVAFELEAVRSLPMDDGEVFLCKIRNVLSEESLRDEGKTLEERFDVIRPVNSTCNSYFSWDGKFLGAWGEPMKELREES